MIEFICVLLFHFFNASISEEKSFSVLSKSSMRLLKSSSQRPSSSSLMTQKVSSLTQESANANQASSVSQGFMFSKTSANKQEISRNWNTKLAGKYSPCFFEATLRSFSILITLNSNENEVKKTWKGFGKRRCIKPAFAHIVF